MPIRLNKPILTTCRICKQQFYYRPKSDVFVVEQLCTVCQLKKSIQQLFKGK